MRYIKYLFLAALGIVLITVALANREIVTLRLLPEELGGLMGFNGTIALPLFIIIFLGIAAGLLIGFFWEWLREHKHRAEASKKSREAAHLEREVKRLKRRDPEEKDEVLALLEDSERAR